MSADVNFGFDCLMIFKSEGYILVKVVFLLSI